MSPLYQSKRRPVDSSDAGAALDDEILPELRRRQTESLLRERHIVGTPQGVHPRIDGQPYLAFCSNDYLGLANHPKVVEAFRRAAAEYGVGAGASHLITGHSLAHGALEEELADFTGREAALLFSTGYMANLGVTSALVGRGDTVFEDRLNHASLVDGGILSRARLRRYPHADAAALAEALARNAPGRKLVLTDGVFSMDGDLAPVPDLFAAAERHGAWVMVDDAHGIGVMGPTGRGTLEHYGLGAQDIPILVGTLGKALGTFGAFVAGSCALKDMLIQSARSYIYTTALPPAVAEATRASLKIIREEPWRRQHLGDRVVQFRRGAAAMGLALTTSSSPIQPILLGDTEAALAASRALRRRGIFISAIRPPTVPQGTSRLRVTFSSGHDAEDVDRLLEALQEVLG